MFDQTFVNAQAKTRRPWTVAVSLALQSALVIAALVVPLLHVAALNAPPKLPVWVPVGKLDLAAKPEAKAAPQRQPVARTAFHLATLRAPAAVPRQVDLAPAAPEIQSGFADAGQLNSSAGSPFGTLLLALDARAVPPPAPAVKPQAPPERPSVPVRVGGGVQAAKLIFGPKPVYPPLARTTRTQGTVRIRAWIGRDGTIRNLQLLSGPPLLVQAALDAVGRWRYRPTLLNGQPVEVLTDIDVNFTIGPG